jgi:hypothetical protein
MAKACGPDPPMPGSSRVGMTRAATVTNKARTPGRARHKPLNHCAGKAGFVSVEPVVTAACFPCCRRAMGAASARSSLRPLPEEGHDRCRTRADHAAGTKTLVLSSLRGANGSARTRGPMTASATKQSRLVRGTGLDCFASLAVRSNSKSRARRARPRHRGRI